MFTVGIVTLSDKGAAGNREDLSGTKIKEMLPDDLYQVLSYRILPDEQKEIEQELVRLSDELHCDLVLTTGGTGFSTRDVTAGSDDAGCREKCAGYRRGNPCIQLDDYQTGDAQSWCQCDTGKDTDHKSAGKSKSG